MTSDWTGRRADREPFPHRHRLSIAPTPPMFGVMLGDVGRSSRARRRITRILAASLAAACWILGGASPVLAHPIGNFTINLYSGVRVLPGQVRIEYVLEMAEISTQEQKPGMDLDGDEEISLAEMDSWAARASAQIATNLALLANGQPVDLILGDSSLHFRPGQGGLDLIYMQATFEGTIPESGEMRYTDANYLTRPGWREISAAAGAGVALTTSSVPDRSISDELTAYPPEMFDQPPRVGEATFSFQPSDAPVESTGASASGGDPTSSTGSSSPAGSGGFADLLATSSNRAFGLLLLLAFGFGFIHALGPGHGKTIMAASTLSGSVRLRHAMLLGGVVALMHCLTVVGLGAIAYAASQTITSERVFSWLKLITALVVVIVGAVMLVVRLRERRGLAHDQGPHGHRHPHPKPPAAGTSGMDRAGIAAVAASGGLIPSPSAVVVLLGAIAVDRIPMGIALVVMFSLGLATSLVLVGTASHLARSRLGRTESRMMEWLPIAAAVAIFAVGVLLTVQALASHPFRT